MPMRFGPQVACLGAFITKSLFSCTAILMGVNFIENVMVATNTLGSKANTQRNLQFTPDELAEAIACEFDAALTRKLRYEGARDPQTAGLERPLCNEVLLGAQWRPVSVWTWKKPLHINILETRVVLALHDKAGPVFSWCPSGSCVGFECWTFCLGQRSFSHPMG